LPIHQRAALLRANSTAVRDAIVAECPAAASRVRVVPNPLPITPAPAAPWGTRAKIVLYAGRLHPEKGLELLLQAWRIVQTHPGSEDWQLHLVGPVDPDGGGGGRVWWDSLHRRFSNERVHVFAPVYQEAQLNSLYAAARIFVYPSVAERGETFGSAVLEAMSHGTPPIVSNLACFTDFVHADRNGLVFDHRQPEPAKGLAEV